MPEVDDGSLARALLAGEPGGFDRLVDRYHAMMYRVAWGMCRNHADADDVVQTSFIKAFEQLSSFDPRRAALASWLRRIVVTVTIDLMRRESRLRDRTVAAARTREYTVVAAPTDTETEERSDALRAAMDHLSEQQRAIVVLHEVEELPSSEIASILDTTAQNVRVQLCAARQKLFEHLQKRAGET